MSFVVLFYFSSSRKMLLCVCCTLNNLIVNVFSDRESVEPDAVQQERSHRTGGPAVAQVREGGGPLHQRKTGRILQKN